MATPAQVAFGRLRFRQLGSRVEGPPNRRLIVDVELLNATSMNAVVLGLAAEVQFNPGGVAATGQLFEQQHPLNGRALLPAHGKMSGRFVVPVSPEILAAVQNDRTDRVIVTVRGRGLVAPVLAFPVGPLKRVRAGTEPKPPMELMLAAPFETEAVDENGSAMVTLIIPASEWIKHLKNWCWEEVEVFQIALTSRSEPAQFRLTYENLRKAQQSYRDNDYNATLNHARRALEGMAKAAGEGNVKAGYEALFARKFGGPTMTADFDELVKALTDFAHAGRHQAVPDEPVSRADALLALHVTFAIVERLTH